VTTTKLDQFTRAYIETALWSSIGDDYEPLDATYGVEDIAPEALERIIADCAAFQAANAEDIATGPDHPEYNSIELAGHDFWLTRNGHGAGFWDGDWPEDVGERLTQAAKKFGQCDLYVGDDGKLYV
jgi:hypothetical protein